MSSKTKENEEHLTNEGKKLQKKPTEYPFIREKGEDWGGREGVSLPLERGKGVLTTGSTKRG